MPSSNRTKQYWAMLSRYLHIIAQYFFSVLLFIIAAAATNAAVAAFVVSVLFSSEQCCFVVVGTLPSCLVLLQPWEKYWADFPERSTGPIFSMFQKQPFYNLVVKPKLDARRRGDWVLIFMLKKTEIKRNSLQSRENLCFGLCPRFRIFGVATLLKLLLTFRRVVLSLQTRAAGIFCRCH